MEAYRQGLTLVTYDTKTIVPLLKMWGEQGVTHGGVIFVKASAIAPHNIGGLMRALVKLWTQYGKEDWTNASIYLSPSTNTRARRWPPPPCSPHSICR